MRASVMMLMVALAFGPAEAWASQKPAPTDVEGRALKQMAAAIPLGSRVKAQMIGGKRVTGTLMSVTDDVVVIKKKTRLPEPAVAVPFGELATLELQTHEGISVPKILGIGLAAGAGAILTLFAFVAAIDD